MEGNSPGQSGAELLRGGEAQEVIELKRQGLTINAIVEPTSGDRKTMIKCLRERDGTLAYRLHPSMLDAFKPSSEAHLKFGVGNAVVLLSEPVLKSSEKSGHAR